MQIWKRIQFVITFVTYLQLSSTLLSSYYSMIFNSLCIPLIHKLATLIISTSPSLINHQLAKELQSVIECFLSWVTAWFIPQLQHSLARILISYLNGLSLSFLISGMGWVLHHKITAEFIIHMQIKWSQAFYV